MEKATSWRPARQNQAINAISIDKVAGIAEFPNGIATPSGCREFVQRWRNRASAPKDRHNSGLSTTSRCSVWCYLPRCFGSICPDVSCLVKTSSKS
jgi:hypothetical protein